MFFIYRASLESGTAYSPKNDCTSAVRFMSSHPSNADTLSSGVYVFQLSTAKVYASKNNFYVH